MAPEASIDRVTAYVELASDLAVCQPILPQFEDASIALLVCVVVAAGCMTRRPVAAVYLFRSLEEPEGLRHG
jgi:hypothetical protein